VKGRVINLDALPHNADWTKQTLAFLLTDGHGGLRRVENLADLCEYLRLHRIEVAAFKRMPAYTNALRKQPWLRRL
jgi:hypothetical protein